MAKNKRALTFLTIIGCSAYKLMRSLVSPSKPGDKTLEELFRVLEEHYNPTPLENVQRFKFHSQVRHKVGYFFILLSKSKYLAEYYNFQNQVKIWTKAQRFNCLQN